MPRSAARTTLARTCMLREEHTFQSDGYRPVAGVDEAGRGPLAGPVVAAAVILGRAASVPGIADSKTLSASRRILLADQLRSHGADIGVGFAAPSEIDSLNIHAATFLAMRRAVAQLRAGPAMVLVDGYLIRDLHIEQRFYVKGDARCTCIAAASIIAKTTRDAIMERMHEEFPGYGFDRHKGYPTREHYDALARLGPCPHHRRSFRLT